MEFKQFLEEIQMPEGAIQELLHFQVSRSDYKNLKYLYQNERDIFFQNVLQMADFRIRFLYCFSYMAWELYESGVWKERCVPFVKHGLDPCRIFIDTFFNLTLWCEDCYEKTGEYGFLQYDWIWRHLDGSLFRLGRLQFELLGEDIHIHIPAGKPLDFEQVQKSLEQAKRVWGMEKRYLCHSWLLYPGLKEILPEESDILKFQQLFTIISSDYDTREAEERIFGKVEERPEEYPTHTSLQKNARKFLLEGNQLGNGFGILKEEK